MQKQPSPTNILECRHYFPWEIPFLVRLHHILHCTTTIPKCCRLNKKNRVWLVETAILQKSIACSKAGKRGLGNLISKYRDLQALLITVINRTLTMVLQILIYSAKHRFKGYFFFFQVSLYGMSLYKPCGAWLSEKKKVETVSKQNVAPGSFSEKHVQ